MVWEEEGKFERERSCFDVVRGERSDEAPSKVKWTPKCKTTPRRPPPQSPLNSHNSNRTAPPHHPAPHTPHLCLRLPAKGEATSLVGFSISASPGFVLVPSSPSPVHPPACPHPRQRLRPSLSLRRIRSASRLQRRWSFRLFFPSSANVHRPILPVACDTRIATTSHHCFHRT